MLRFQTYFPHIDNVYSHRSTQRHKRRRFVSHYWDCRLKGRPPGTKKSTDPDKKKRKRVARERDLCDVKIKITEFFDQGEYEEQLGQRPPDAAQLDATSPLATMISGRASASASQNHQYFVQPQILPQQPVGPWDMASNMSQPGMHISPYTPALPVHQGPPPKRFYTFQRVNGNGGNGKGDGIAGPHKHSLEESDRVKKNSVFRWQAKADKDDRKKVLVSSLLFVFQRGKYQTLHCFISGCTCACVFTSEDRPYTSFRCMLLVFIGLRRTNNLHSHKHAVSNTSAFQFATS